MTDQDLVTACLRQEPTAQRTLFNRFAPVMMGVCRRYCPDADEAADAHQLGFIRVFERLSQYKGGALEGWIRRVIVTTCLNHLDSRKRRQEWQQPIKAEDNNVTDEASAFFDFLEAEQLENAIMQLPDGARVVFNLFAVEGYPHTEIAAMLKITESTSRAQLARARKLLQERLGFTKHTALTIEISKTNPASTTK